MNYCQSKSFKIIYITIFLALPFSLQMIFAPHIYGQQENFDNAEISETITKNKNQIERPDTTSDIAVASEFKSIDVDKSAGGLSVIVKANGIIKDYQSFTLNPDNSQNSPARIVFDILNLKSAFKKEQSISVNTQWVSKIRHYAYPDKFRIVFDTKDEFLKSFYAKPVSNGLLISFGAPDISNEKDISSESIDQNITSEQVAVAKTDKITDVSPGFTKDPNTLKTAEISPSPGMDIQVSEENNVISEQQQHLSLPGLAMPNEQPVPQINSISQKSSRSSGKVILNFDDADVYEVIQTIFGQVLKVNYIVDPRVKGRVTFRSSAPVAQANVLPLMEVILRLNGIAVVEESDLYRLIPISDISKEPTAVQLGRESKKIDLTGKALLQVIPINYMQSSDVLKLLTPFVSTNAVMVDVPMNNQIIIVDTDANIKRLLELVEIFDNEQQKTKGPQVFVYPVQNGKAKDIATQLQQIFLGAKPSGEKTVTAVTSQPQKKAAVRDQQISRSISGEEAVVSGITRIFSDETLNAVIVLSTPEDYEIIKDAIAKIDLEPRQVIIEGVIAQIALKDEFSLGLAWSINTKNFGGSPADITFNASSLDADNLPGSTGLRFVGTDSGGSVRAVVNALALKSKAKLLASPHIIVSDNREATIQVGQQVPIVTSETFGSTTVAPQRTIQYKDIGIILNVKPQVNDSGLVSLEIKQEVSSYETISLSATQDDIILNKTEASTNLVVQDGHTIIIGGLIREDKTKSRTGIPWLSQIPLLGFLFGNTTDDQTRTELIILLTPHVVKTQNDAQSLTSGYIDKFTEEGKGGVNKNELMGNSCVVKNPEDKNDSGSLKVK